MSHFSVLAILPPGLPDPVNSPDCPTSKALHELLIPYKERGCGDEDPEGFVERFCTFEEDEDGREGHEGKRGYWRNPNQKWDWWKVGGRFRGAIGEDDTVRLRDWNPPKERRWNAESMWAAHQKIEAAKAAGTKPDMMDQWNLSHALHDLGLMRKTEGQQDGRPGWEPIPFTLEDLRTTHAWYFLPATYAVLDSNGWKAKAKMGWFGCDDSEMERSKAWALGWHKLVTERDPDSILVLIDCHI